MESVKLNLDLNDKEQEIWRALPSEPSNPSSPDTWPDPVNGLQKLAQDRCRHMLDCIARFKSQASDDPDCLDAFQDLLLLWENSTIERWLAVATEKQAKFVEAYLHGTWETLAAIGGNRSAKSASAGLGFATWIRDHAPEGAVAWVVSPEDTVSINGAQKLLWNLLPHAKLKPAWNKKNGFGAKNPIATYEAEGRDITIRFINETQFENNDKKVEGTSVDRIWIDESIGAEMYSALLMRLLDSENKTSNMLISSIPNEEWMYEQIEHAKSDRILFERFYPADNPVLTKAKYAKALESVPKHKRGVRIHGEFDIQNSLVYPEFDRSKHVVSTQDAIQMASSLKPKWYAGLDIGRDHPTVFLIGCTLSNGKFLVYNEYAATKTLVSEDAIGIKAVLGDRTLEAGFVAIDPSAANLTKGNPLSVMEMYIEEGVECLPAIRTQIAGEERQVEEIREMFACDNLLICERCDTLIRHLCLWKHKRDRHNKPMSQRGSKYQDKDNDGPDAMRYMLTQVWCDYGSFDHSKGAA